LDLDVSRDVIVINIFIMNHSKGFAIFNEHVKVNLFSIVETRFAWHYHEVQDYKKRS